VQREPPARILLARQSLQAVKAPGGRVEAEAGRQVYIGDTVEEQALLDGIEGWVHHASRSSPDRPSVRLRGVSGRR